MRRIVNPKPEDLILNRYRLKKTLGQSAAGVTALAIDEKNSTDVVVKLLNLEKLENWKQYELLVMGNFIADHGSNRSSSRGTKADWGRSSPW
jgi:hypothetical protein